MKRVGELIGELSGLLSETYEAWRDDRVIRLGAALAYYALFGVVPLLTIAVAVAGFFFSTQEVQDYLTRVIEGFVHAEADGVVAGLTDRLEDALPGLGIIGAATLLLGASLVFVALQDVLNVIWHAPVRAGFGDTVRSRILAFSVVLASAGMVIAGLLADALITLLESLIPGDVDLLSSLAGYLVPAVSWALAAVAISAVFRLLPYAEVPWRDAVIGGVVTALLAVVGSNAFTFFLSEFGTASVSGAAGSLLLMLVWIYYQAQILLAGAELTRVLGQRSARSL